ncbi:MAG: DUF1905 domain-containing protein [Bdellovibrionales bacterium]|nr:DUF1905 domain-containing protein [Bdellovibrionales bacterium]
MNISLEEGWGRLKATESIGKTHWQTAIWHDSKFKSYLLPIKSAVRKDESIEIGVSTLVTVAIESEDLRTSFLLRRSPDQ